MACPKERSCEVLTLDTKRAILERLQKGAKPSLLAKELNCRKATISDIKNNTKTSSSTQRCKTLKKEAHEDVERRRQHTCGSCRSIAEGPVA